jgi:hypothetical protein
MESFKIKTLFGWNKQQREDHLRDLNHELKDIQEAVSVKI